MLFSSKQTSSWVSLTYCSHEVTGLLLTVYIKVILFLRAPLFLNFQILYSKMSQFPWEELQGSLLLQVAFPPGPKLCTTAAKMGAKIVSGLLFSKRHPHFSKRVLGRGSNFWCSQLVSQHGTPTLWAIWDKSNQVPSIPSLSFVEQFPPYKWGRVDEESPVTLSHFYLE